MNLIPLAGVFFGSLWKGLAQRNLYCSVAKFGMIQVMHSTVDKTFGTVHGPASRLKNNVLSDAMRELYLGRSRRLFGSVLCLLRWRRLPRVKATISGQTNNWELGTRAPVEMKRKMLRTQEMTRNEPSPAPCSL